MHIQKQAIRLVTHLPDNLALIAIVENPLVHKDVLLYHQSHGRNLMDSRIFHIRLSRNSSLQL